MSERQPSRKRIRLDAALYADSSAICSVTLAVTDRFCFMPDHVHLLLSPLAGTSLIDFVRDFKGETTRLAWQHGYDGQLWQRFFFDHFLRRDEDFERTISYIRENPVRAGLVSQPGDYDFSGPNL